MALASPFCRGAPTDRYAKDRRHATTERPSWLHEHNRLRRLKEWLAIWIGDTKRGRNRYEVGSETKVKPVGAKNNRTDETNEDYKQNDATASAQAAPSKAKIVLQPAVEPFKQEKFQQSGQTAGAFIHQFHATLPRGTIGAAQHLLSIAPLVGRFKQIR